MTLGSSPGFPVPSVKWEQGSSPGLPFPKVVAAAGSGGDHKENSSKAWLRPSSLAFPAAVSRGPHIRAPGPRALPGQPVRAGGAERAPRSGAQAPPRGRSEGGAEPRGEQSRLQSPLGQPRLGDRPTEPGREPPEQGSGERVSSQRRRLPAALCGLTPRARLEVGGGEVVPASDSLAGGVSGALAKGRRLKIIGGWEAGGAGERGTT